MAVPEQRARRGQVGPVYTSASALDRAAFPLCLLPPAPRSHPVFVPAFTGRPGHPEHGSFCVDESLHPEPAVSSHLCGARSSPLSLSERRKE